MKNPHFLILFFIFSHFCFSQNSREIDSLIQLSNNPKNDSIQFVAFHKLSIHYFDSDLKKALFYNNLEFKLAKKHKSNLYFAKSHNVRGIIYDINGDLDSAFVSYQKALVYAKKDNDKLLIASVYNNFGLLDWNKSNFLKAIQYYNKALRIFEEIDDKLGQSNALSNIGLVYQSFKDYKNAEKYLYKSLEIKNETKDNYGLSVSYTNLGSLFDDLKNYDKAIFNYKKAIAYKRILNDQRGIAIANNNLSQAYLYLDKNVEAEKCLLESIAITKKINATSLLAYAYIGITNVYIQNKNIKKAIESNDLATIYNAKIGDKLGLSNIYKNKEAIAVLQNNFKEAYNFSKKALSISDTLRNKETQESVAEIENKYQIEKKEKELLKSKAQLVQKEIETKQKNNILIIASILVLAFLIIGFLIFKQQKQKNQQQAQENDLKLAIEKIENQNKLQEQRLNISRDLHDNIGSQLTFIISSVDNVKYGFDITNEKLDNKLTNISSFAKDTIVELRDTIWAMNSNEISFEDFEARINNYIEKAKLSQENISFSFAIDEDLKTQKLSSVEGMNIYRTIQEAVNNSLKYANASIIAINAKKLDSQIKITIQDNGKGFKEDQIEKGNGLNNMKKRIEEIGGSFSLTSGVEGTKISILI
jgi:signal transduction histidine kinase